MPRTHRVGLPQNPEAYYGSDGDVWPIEDTELAPAVIGTLVMESVVQVSETFVSDFNEN